MRKSAKTAKKPFNFCEKTMGKLLKSHENENFANIKARIAKLKCYTQHLRAIFPINLFLYYQGAMPEMCRSHFFSNTQKLS